MTISKRCDWSTTNEKMQKYHDTEWGVPVHDDQTLFEYMVLDAFQAGLSWNTILNKRENFREAFDEFDWNKIALYTEEKEQELLLNKGIIRNKLKIKATITNARQYQKIIEEYGSFDSYIWKFFHFIPKINQYKSMSEIPSVSEEAITISKDLKKRGFKFVGPTIIYAFLQAAGMINDHIISCPRHNEIMSYY